MAKTLEVRVCYLLLEIAAHTFIIIRALAPARAVTTSLFKPFPDSVGYFLIWIDCDLQILSHAFLLM